MRSRARDLLIYVSIGLAIVGSIALYEVLVPAQQWIHLSYKWFSFIFFTILLAVILAKVYWQKRRKAKLWLLFALFMTAHVAAFAVFLSRVPSWPTLWYIPTCTAEAVLFMVIAKHWLNVMPKATRL